MFFDIPLEIHHKSGKRHSNSTTLCSDKILVFREVCGEINAGQSPLPSTLLEICPWQVRGAFQPIAPQS